MVTANCCGDCFYALSQVAETTIVTKYLVDFDKVYEENLDDQDDQR